MRLHDFVAEAAGNTATYSLFRGAFHVFVVGGVTFGLIAAEAVG